MNKSQAISLILAGYTPRYVEQLLAGPSIPDDTSLALAARWGIALPVKPLPIPAKTKRLKLR